MEKSRQLIKHRTAGEGGSEMTNELAYLRVHFFIFQEFDFISRPADFGIVIVRDTLTL
jgi:hypothetical protein